MLGAANADPTFWQKFYIRHPLLLAKESVESISKSSWLKSFYRFNFESADRIMHIYFYTSWVFEENVHIPVYAELFCLPSNQVYMFGITFCFSQAGTDFEMIGKNQPR